MTLDQITFSNFDGWHLDSFLKKWKGIKQGHFLKKMLLAFRWLATSLLFYAGLFYAAFLALQRPTDRNSLKLWSFLIVLYAASNMFDGVLVLVIPMFLEFRCILLWAFLSMEPHTWAYVYDGIFDPSIGKVAAALAVLAKGETSRRLLLSGMQLQVDLLQVTTNAAVSCGAVADENAMRSALFVLSGQIDHNAHKKTA